MKPHLQEILADIKAAAAIGHPDTLGAVMDSVRELNDDDLPPTALVPLGRGLAGFQNKYLAPLLMDADPAARGLAAVALADRFLRFGDELEIGLSKAAEDANPEVRRALIACLEDVLRERKGLLKGLQAFKILVNAWLTSTSERQVETGLRCFGLCQPDARETQEMLSPLHMNESHDIREALVDCLGVLASQGLTEPVLCLLEDWANTANPNVWVITQALSSSWAIKHHDEAVRILNILVEEVGMIRPIIRTLDRLQTTMEG